MKRTPTTQHRYGPFWFDDNGALVDLDLESIQYEYSYDTATNDDGFVTDPPEPNDDFWSSMDNAVRPIVLVIEAPDEDPYTVSVGEVDILTATDYFGSKYNNDADAAREYAATLSQQAAELARGHVRNRPLVAALRHLAANIEQRFPNG